MTTNNLYPLLETINSPDDLKKIDKENLPLLANQMRAFLIDSLSKTGGHLSSSLGTVELTIALHYVFNTPYDDLVWDVGHQTYPHKILTGRKQLMPGLRKRNGISGFLKRSESKFDSFGAGHSSTSISAALGMAAAKQQNGNLSKSVAIIGDGALTAGLAYEALNHAGHIKSNILVILNDNEMSISPNVGGMSNYLARLLSGTLYSTVRESGKKVLSAVPPVRELARRAEEHMKGMVVPSTLFEELGFNYLGPVDGHDINTLVKTIENLNSLSGPQLLHVITKKGKGYQPAEENPCAYHGVTPFNSQNGKMHKKSTSGPSYTQVFGQWLCDMAQTDEKLIGITPAMCEGSGMVQFSNQFKDRFFDVGIAEQHSITFAAGLACEGLKPVVAIYSTFLQRGYDQLIHDVALQNLPVLFAIDRAGVVGADGPTHAGSFDISFLRCIPNMVIMAPSDENECRQMLFTGYQHNGPCAVRYPRGCGPGVSVDSKMTEIPIGKAEIKRSGSKIALLAFGSMVDTALEIGDEIDATVINMRFVKPLDEELISAIANSHSLLVTLEENAKMGGAGSAINEFICNQMIDCNIVNLGYSDCYLEHGSRDELLMEDNLDKASILNELRQIAPDLSQTIEKICG